MSTVVAGVYIVLGGSPVIHIVVGYAWCVSVVVGPAAICVFGPVGKCYTSCGACCQWCIGGTWAGVQMIGWRGGRLRACD